MEIPIIGASVPLVGLPPKDELKVIGREMIMTAYNHQCFAAPDTSHPRYYRRIGLDWNVGLTLERFHDPPRYHASFEALHTIGSESDMNLGVPEQAIVRVTEWPTEVTKICGEILGEIMAPLIKRADQRIHVEIGLFAVHWLTEAQYAD